MGGGFGVFREVKMKYNLVIYCIWCSPARLPPNHFVIFQFYFSPVSEKFSRSRDFTLIPGAIVRSLHDSQRLISLVDRGRPPQS